MALVELQRFVTSIEASIARSYLASHGVESYIFDAENQWDTYLRVEVPPRLMVAEEDYQEAARLLAQLGDEEGDSL